MADIKTNLFTIASDIRYFLLTGLETLPLTIGGALLLIGHFIGSYAMLFFLTGYLGLVPLAACLFNLAGNYFFGKDFMGGGKDAGNCNVITGSMDHEKSDMLISYWMAMIAFFIGYMFTNAYQLYSDAKDGITNPGLAISEAGLTLIQSQTINAMIVILAFTCIILYVRVVYSGCDFGLGNTPALILSLVLTVLFAVAGYGWYMLLAGVGQNRLSDIFGISNRVMTNTSMENLPYACLPSA